MSGIYIPGVEMPRCCMDCHYHRSLQDQCILTHRDQRDLWSRPDWCPLVPVPAHGRFGDLDELLKRIKEEGCNQAEFYADRYHPVVLAYGDCYGKVKNAPTIIPASEEGET